MHYMPERTYTHENDEEVCNCIGVLRHEIIDSIADGNHQVQDVGDDCGAGGGCGECHLEIARMIAKTLLGSEPTLKGMTPEKAIESMLIPLAKRINANVAITAKDADEIVLTVTGDESHKQTIALWAEAFIEPLMGPNRYIEVG